MQWQERYDAVRTWLLPWIAASVPLRDATVLEYGCGTGAVACALGPQARRHIGVDIDADAIALAREHVREFGLENVELECHPLESILARVADLEGEVDVVLLYAVLEHLTVDERLDLLRLARRIVRPPGHIVICETPNRLQLWDHHTTQMPFFYMLPEELQLRYWDRSPRPDFTDAMRAASAAGPGAAREALVRWGRGVSFHEFELVFEDLPRHVIADGFDPRLFPERDLHSEEITLARFLAQQFPQLSAGWARYWLDLILTPEPATARLPPLLRPWTMEPGIGSSGCSWTASESIHMAGPDARLRVSLPAPARRLVCGFALGGEHGTLFVTPLSSRGPAPTRVLSATSPPTWPNYHDLHCQPAASEFELTIEPAGYVTFVGWLADA
ncbi:MAG: class I SAM-dependent methyltransferase [Actinomycetota bacterium]|nr:class I SAM-dependent methyltransferase [Actinomycetota bacterium]